MQKHIASILFLGLLLVGDACEERAESPSSESRFRTREILVGRTVDPPQGFAYSARTADGHVAVVINKIDPAAANAPREDMYVEKYSSDGVLAWSKRFTTEFGMRGATVLQTSNGDLLVVATRRKSLTFGDEDLVLIRLASSGDQVWTRSYASDLLRRPVQMIELANGELLLDVETLQQGYILKFDANGNETGMIDKAGLGCAAGSRLSAAPDGDFTVGSPNASKISPHGVVRFCKEVSVYSCTEPFFIGASLKTPDNENYFMLGSALTPIEPNSDCIREDRSDLFVTQFDGNGEPVATRTIDLAFNDYAQDMEFTPDNGIAILSEGSAQNSGLDSKAYLLKLRHDLSTVWSEELSYSLGGATRPLSVHTMELRKYAVLLNTQNLSTGLNEIKLIFLTEQL